MKGKTKNIFYLFPLLLIISFFPSFSLAGNQWSTDLNEMIQSEILNPLKTITIGGAMLMIIIGGFEYMSSGGEPRKISAGKEKIFAGIAGFLIIFFADDILGMLGI